MADYISHRSTSTFHLSDTLSVFSGTCRFHHSIAGRCSRDTGTSTSVDLFYEVCNRSYLLLHTKESTYRSGGSRGSFYTSGFSPSTIKAFLTTKSDEDNENLPTIHLQLSVSPYQYAAEATSFSMAPHSVLHKLKLPPAVSSLATLCSVCILSTLATDSSTTRVLGKAPAFISLHLLRFAVQHGELLTSRSLLLLLSSILSKDCPIVVDYLPLGGLAAGVVDDRVADALCTSPMISQHLLQLDLSYSEKLTEEGLRKLLVHCQNLTHLSVKRCTQAVSDYSLSFVKASKLQWVDMQGCFSVTPIGLQALIDGAPGLKYLWLGECPLICDANLVYISQHAKQLELLSLVNATNPHSAITPAGLKFLSACTQLHTLCISEMIVSTLFVAAIEEILTKSTSLKKLYLDWCSGDATQQLFTVLQKSVTRLTHLSVIGCRWQWAWIEAFKKENATLQVWYDMNGLHKTT